MPPAYYSFIDIVVLDEVRERFARGEAIVILSTDLSEVLWANGPGAAVFGQSDIEAVIGAPSGLGSAARRQIMSTRGFPNIGKDRKVTIRIIQGMQSRALSFVASALTMPDGEDAIMLVLPDGADERTAGDASAAISGFTQPGHLVALIDGRGTVEAASAGFERLGLSSQALRDLARDVARAPDGLIKRIVAGTDSRFPAGIARLSDEPARNLLMVVDEEAFDDAPGVLPTEAVAQQPQPVVATSESVDPVPDLELDEEASSAEAHPESVDAEPGVVAEQPVVAATRDEAGAPDPAIADVVADHQPASHEDAGRVDVPDSIEPPVFEDDRAIALGPTPTPDERALAKPANLFGEPETEGPIGAVPDAATEPSAVETVGEVGVTGHPIIERSGEASTATPGKPVEDYALENRMDASDAGLPAADRAARIPAPPVRFVWRTDAEGRFSSLSPEFVAAVGEAAGDVIGKPFGEVSAVLGLDPNDEIAGLLARRDTWSGRSVLWPIAGTDLKVPVDLAALPVYSRDRSFEGFRGFGVARMADVVMDPEAYGLKLDSDGSIEAFSAAAVGLIEADDAKAEILAVVDPFAGEVPVLTIVPQLDRRFSDKIIKLVEHRSPPPERSLSPVEKVAFREIGERLKKAENAERKPTGAAIDPPAAADTTPTDDNIPDPAKSGEVAREAASDDEVPTFQAAPDVQPTDATREPDFLGTQAMAGEAGSDPIDDAETATEEQTVERDLLTTDLFEPIVTSADANEVEADTSAGTFSALKEGYAPSNYEGWSELTPPADQAVETLADTPTEARQVDINAPAEPRSAPVATGQDRIPTDAEIEFARLADEIDAAERQAVADRSARDLPHANATPRGDEPYAPSNYEGWSELTPLVGEAKEEVEASELAEHETEPESAPEEPYALAPASSFEDTSMSDPAHSIEHPRVPGAAWPVQDTAILARLPVPILIHSGDMLHYANDEFLDLTGYKSGAALAQAGGLGALFAEPYVGATVGDADRALRLKTSDGQEFPIDALLRAIPWQGSRALMLVVRRTGEADGPLAPPLLEIGERDELKSRLAEMRTIIDTATDGVILIDNEGQIRSISRPAEALFGYESDDIQGQPFVSLFAIESQRAARDYLGRLADNGVGSVLNDGREVIGREAEGRFIPLFMSIGRLPNASGFCAVVRDLTQWKRAEEELTHARSLAERASSQKTDFLARISHEIRTPLNAIIGFSELMMDERFGSVGNERYRDYLRDINRAGNHVLDLVNDLLDISKIEAGEQEMAHEAVSLNETLGQSVAIMQPQANRERVIIRSSLASRLPDVVADLRSVRQIALNLLSNAIRYTQAGGQVIVSTSYEPTGDVVLRIRDTGIGMTQAEIEQALKPFKQINALKRTRGDGTGLGLPLTKAMVEANRARFAINSTPGEGTLVEVTFPAARVLAH